MINIILFLFFLGIGFIFISYLISNIIENYRERKELYKKHISAMYEDPLLVAAKKTLDG